MHVKVNDGLAYLSIVSACDDSGPSHKKNWRQSGQRQDFENADQSGLCRNTAGCLSLQNKMILFMIEPEGDKNNCMEKVLFIFV